MSASNPDGDGIDPHELVKLPSTARHFACTSCGKCCTRAPILTIEEGFRLSDVFILSAFVLYHGGGPDVQGTSLRKNDLDSSTPVRMTLHCRPLNWTEHNKRCPALVGTSCGIYERRPARCRTAPFALDLRPELISKAPIWTPEEGAERGFTCDWSSQAPLIVDSSGLVDPAYAEAYRQGREEIGVSQEYLVQVPDPIIEDGWHYFEESTGELSLNFTPFIMDAVCRGRLTDDEAKTILTNQIALIDRQEKDALSRRMSDERFTTQIIRQTRKLHRHLLDNFEGQIEGWKERMYPGDDDDDSETLEDFLEFVGSFERDAAKENEPAASPPADVSRSDSNSVALLGGTLPEEGPSAIAAPSVLWRGGRDAIWAQFFRLAGWPFEYLGNAGSSSPSFQFTEGDTVVDAWTVDEAPTPETGPWVAEFIARHGNFRKRSARCGILLLPLRLGLWEWKGKRSALLGWYLPPGPPADTIWIGVFVRRGAESVVALVRKAIAAAGAPSTLGDTEATKTAASRFQEAATMTQEEGHARAREESSVYLLGTPPRDALGLTSSTEPVESRSAFPRRGS